MRGCCRELKACSRKQRCSQQLGQLGGTAEGSGGAGEASYASARAESLGDWP
uniref:Uncharacterized protein n=1 Tax=Arundo donax TaxID=35708 RepID=A0A0A8ZBP9_ARUDO